MAKGKTQSKQKPKGNRPKDIAGQLEHAFLAGLGALSNAQEVGAKTFDSLVKQGEAFRKEATDKTESLIDDVQDAIREMAGGAQSRATGLLDQMRDASQLEKLNSVFDTRVAATMDRLGVPSKNDIDMLNSKLDRLLSAVERPRTVKSKKAKTTTKRKTKKKAAKKKATKKPAAKAAKKSRKKSTARAK